MRMILKVGLIILLIVSIFSLGMFVDNLVLIGNVVREIDSDYSWTSAICDENNNCLDVLIRCSGGKVVDLKPITGLVDHPEDWIDPRDFKEFC